MRSAGQQVEQGADGHSHGESEVPWGTKLLHQCVAGSWRGGEVAAVGRLDMPDPSLCLSLSFPVCEAVTMLPCGPSLTEIAKDTIELFVLVFLF